MCDNNNNKNVLLCALGDDHGDVNSVYWSNGENAKYLYFFKLLVIIIKYIIKLIIIMYVEL